MPHSELTSNVYLQHVLANYECFVQGLYHKVLILKDTLPSKNFYPFAPRLVESIRNEIFASLPKCYEKIESKDAAKLLFFERLDDFKTFSAQKGLIISGSPNEVLDFSSYNQERALHKDLEPKSIIDNMMNYVKYFEYGI